MEEIGYSIIKPANEMRKKSLLVKQSTDKKELIEELVEKQMDKIEEVTNDKSIVSNKTDCIIYESKYTGISSEVESLFKMFGYVISKNNVNKEYYIHW